MVSAQRAVGGESTAGKYTVEWTSEGEQKSLYTTGAPGHGIIFTLSDFYILYIF